MGDRMTQLPLDGPGPDADIVHVRVRLLHSHPLQLITVGLDPSLDHVRDEKEGNILLHDCGTTGHYAPGGSIGRAGCRVISFWIRSDNRSTGQVNRKNRYRGNIPEGFFAVLPCDLL